jgi:predicted nucleic acid-binding protein
MRALDRGESFLVPEHQHVSAAMLGAGRKARGPRAFDLLIDATAMAAGLPLYTRNPSDLAGLAGLLEIVPVELAA